MHAADIEQVAKSMAPPSDAATQQLCQIRQHLLRQEYEAWTRLSELLDPADAGTRLVDPLHAEISRQMLKLCWIYARSGALDERHAKAHPFLQDLECPDLKFDDLSFDWLES